MSEKPEDVGHLVLAAMDVAIVAYVARQRPGTEVLTADEFNMMLSALAARMGVCLNYMGKNLGADAMMEAFEGLMNAILETAGAVNALQVQKVSPPETFEAGTKH